MIWVNDRTGRFKKRPHYSTAELDISCEQTVRNLFSLNENEKTFITTEELTILIERHTDDFDSSCDLTSEGTDVEGVTYFAKGQKPVVKISNNLQSVQYENRLRTTLTHELFHVLFHDFLYQLDDQPSLFSSDRLPADSGKANKCNRDQINSVNTVDWMEWQAGYACGAFLIPASHLHEKVLTFKKENDVVFQNLPIHSSEGKQLIEHIANTFKTSYDAARIRLLQKGLITDTVGF